MKEVRCVDSGRSDNTRYHRWERGLRREETGSASSIDPLLLLLLLLLFFRSQE
jgi:hypothetical protein